MNKRQIGSYYEQLAKGYLEAKGYHILEANYRIRLGEIDLIARDKEYTVFIEIKYKRSSRHGYPRESVGYAKQQKILQVAAYYMMCRGLTDTPARFDVVELMDGTITHLENAFMKG